MMRQSTDQNQSTNLPITQSANQKQNKKQSANQDKTKIKKQSSD